VAFEKCDLGGATSVNSLLAETSSWFKRKLWQDVARCGKLWQDADCDMPHANVQLIMDTPNSFHYILKILQWFTSDRQPNRWSKIENTW